MLRAADLRSNRQPEKKWVRASFSKAAQDYDCVATLQRTIGDLLLQRLQGLSQQPRCILDIGAGTGYCTGKLRTLFPDSEIVALDLAEGMLSKLHTKFGESSNILKVCGDAETLPFKVETFDLVVSNLAFQWCHSVPDLLSGIRNVLVPEGQLLFSTFSKGTLNELELAWASVDSNTHVNQFVSEEVFNLALTKLGFQEVELVQKLEAVDYPSIEQLMAELKKIGARNLNGNRPRGLTGRGAFQRLRICYPKLIGKPNILQASFNFLIGQARR